MTKYTSILSFLLIITTVAADQALFNAYVASECPMWDAQANLGPTCCCYDKTGDTLKCADAKKNFFANQVKCGWDGKVSAKLTTLPDNVCKPDVKLYKHIYVQIINCFTNAAKYAGGDHTLMPAKTNDTDSLWILISGFLVFFMQSGFAALEVGSTRSKNAQNILLKNMVDNCVGSLIWWMIGYGLAFGEDLWDSGFIGGKGGKFFAGSEFDVTDNAYRDCFFQLAFATTSATIVSGSLAGRTHFWAYFMYSCLTTSIIYPVIVHWTWGSGWLFDDGYYDFAGSGIVHMVGGLSGLIGALAAGPRLGRFAKNVDPNKFKPHNVPLAVIGTLILWFGWFGFNAGSSLSMSGANVSTAAMVSVNTMIAASSGGIVVLLITSRFSRENPLYDVGKMCNGILGGLVCITAPCGNVTGFSSIIIGVIGGLAYEGTSRLVLRMKIDDPLDAFAVHYGGGIAGVLCVGLFDKTTGMFYGHGGKQLWVQLYAGVCITLWVGFWASAAFFSMKYMKLLRISKDEEERGLDASECGGDAYNIELAKQVIELNRELKRDKNSITAEVHKVSPR